MRWFILVSFIFVVSACNRSAIQDQVAGSDSLVINFNEPNSNDIVARTVATTESNAIGRLSQFLGGKKTELFKCGFDGNMIFFANGVKKADIAFKFSEEVCRHFMYSSNGDLTAIQMSAEAADLLRSLSEGKTWY
jgi:hypothetical protein